MGDVEIIAVGKIIEALYSMGFSARPLHARAPGPASFVS
jgi:hypothetical protein